MGGDGSDSGGDQAVERAERDGPGIQPVALGIFVGAAAGDGLDDVVLADWLARVSAHSRGDGLPHAEMCRRMRDRILAVPPVIF